MVSHYGLNFHFPDEQLFSVLHVPLSHLILWQVHSNLLPILIALSFSLLSWKTSLHIPEISPFSDILQIFSPNIYMPMYFSAVFFQQLLILIETNLLIFLRCLCHSVTCFSNICLSQVMKIFTGMFFFKSFMALHLGLWFISNYFLYVVWERRWGFICVSIWTFS